MRHTITIVLLLLIMVLFPSAVNAEETEPITVIIPVSCSAAGSSETFQYVLSQEAEDGTVRTIQTIGLRNGQKGSFKIEIAEPGTYQYTARQTKGTKSGTIYDESTYTVILFVTEDDTGKMTSDVIAFHPGETEKAAMLSFTNKVKGSTPAPTVTSRSVVPSRATGNTSASKTGTSGSAAGSRTTTVRTGDESDIIGNAAVMAAAFVLITILLATGIRKKGGR